MGRLMSKKQPAKDHLYSVGTTASLRWAGAKGKVAHVEVATYADPTITIQGEKRGCIEFPVSDIRWMRAGKEFGRTTHWRTVIARERGSDIVFDGSWSGDYPDLVLHIAEEMEALGRFDRVQRGLRGWENLAHLLIFGGICLMLLYAPYDTWRLYGADWKPGAYAIWGCFALLPLIGLIYVVGTWWRWYRPRRVRDWEDLERVLV